ncbi:MAG: DUF1549 domain-containing protein [Acidobacteria bacterium]|nr:DUF1549 domain-containing protein [Acidobacteriota bacterium]
MRFAFLLASATLLAPAATFEADIHPLFRAKCQGCHNAKTASGGLSLESITQVLRGGKSGAVVVPGRPVDSVLLSLIASGKMPMGGAKLSEPEIAAIRSWIENEERKPPVAERDVQAVLAAKCWVCHGRREKQGGLDLRTREAMLRGGKSGPAIVPGKPEDSLLVKRIGAQEMPPPKLQEQFSVRGLTDGEFAKVKQWIAEGAAPDPEQPVQVSAVNDPAIKAKDREFWSFKTPVRAPQPRVRAATRVRTPVDAFVLADLESKSKSFSPEADPMVLLRRVFFNLTGLPPSPEQIEAFASDRAPDRYEKLVNRLLESPHYGERWGRHWLDAVGYVDSEGGNNSDANRPHAWRYRDYVIRAFNANKPFDRFLTEQIAGDETFDFRTAPDLTTGQLDLLAATGFWRMAPDGTNSTEQNFIPERMDVIAGQIEVLGSAVMGLSVGCARCHDHKYDPIPTRDYYRLVAVLTPAFDPFHWLPGEFPCGGVGAKCDENNTRYLIPKAFSEYRDAQAHNDPVNARIREIEGEQEKTLETYRARLAADKGIKEGKIPALEEAYPDFKAARAANETRIREERAKLKPLPLVRALFDLGPEPPPTRILHRGDSTTPGALVPPGALSILSAGFPEYRDQPLAHSSGRRLALAKWLTDPRHPLTARVMVNRIWQHHFGTGLVSSAGNFGRMGTAPANQALLDWLSTEFVRTGWDIKALHRLILTSTVYRQRSSPTLGEGDLSAYPFLRIDAESVRDSILMLAGRLDTRQFGPADKFKVQPDGEVITEEGKQGGRRSVYAQHRRTQPVSLLDAFDMPFPNPNCMRRGHSVVASQPLHLLNSDLTRTSARYMAGRIMDVAGDDPGRQIERAYLLAFARKPTADEVQASRALIDGAATEWTRQLKAELPAEPVASRARWMGLASLCHTLMNAAEFLYID